jgi:pimeloyl-ACP methyl ester carboxylesterase
MTHVSSADGTPIAFQTAGSGPAVVVVNGAFSTAHDAEAFAAELAGAGFTAVTWDRRARGSSGDARGSVPEREAEDLAAVLAAVAGDPTEGDSTASDPARRSAAVIGHSSGAVLALYAAALGVPMAHLFLSEPPFRFGENDPPRDLPERIQALIDEGRPADAVTTFQLEGIELAPQMVEQIRSSPMFASLVGLAQSTVYDATLTRDVSTPTAAMLGVSVPVAVLSGVETLPFLHAAAERLAGLMPGAEFVEVPESIGHRLDPVATTRIIAERYPARR